MLKRCNGTPNANQYSEGCRCSECKDAWDVRISKRKESDKARRKNSGGASRGGLESGYGFTKQDIMEARGYKQ
jgi:hypothetical protein